MSRIFAAAKENLLYYRLAYVYAFLFSLNSACTAIATSLANAEWSDLSGSSKFMVVILIVANWTGTMLAFLNKTLSRLQQGQTLVETGNTTTITKPTP